MMVPLKVRPAAEILVGGDGEWPSGWSTRSSLPSTRLSAQVGPSGQPERRTRKPADYRAASRKRARRVWADGAAASKNCVASVGGTAVPCIRTS